MGSKLFDLVLHVYRLQGMELKQQVAHGNRHQFDAKTLTHAVAVNDAGDEPVGRLPHDTQAGTAQLPAGLANLRDECDTMADVLGRSVQDFSFQTFLPQERKNLHRGCQRVALSRREQVERFAALPLQLRQQLAEDPLGASRTNVDERQGRRSIVVVVGALHGVGNVQTSQKLLGDGFHGGFIVKR